MVQQYAQQTWCNLLCSHVLAGEGVDTLQGGQHVPSLASAPSDICGIFQDVVYTDRRISLFAAPESCTCVGAQAYKPTQLMAYLILGKVSILLGVS
jgi:hypothetical protein